jgi:hypothetical protein
MTDHPPGLHWVLFDDDRELGRKTYIGYDERGKPRGAHVEQEVDAILDANQKLLSQRGTDRFGDYNLAARVPLTLMEKTGLGDAIAGGDRKYMSKVLNDSDNSKLRTSRGKV